MKRINRELKYSGTILNVYADTLELEGGKKVVYDYIHHDGAAAVVPVREDGKILMVRQYRNALDRYTLEIPAGKFDTPDEKGIVCATRELEEETGYVSDHLETLVTLRTMLAFCNEKIEIFVATNLKKSHQNLDEDEFIDVFAYSINELKQKIFNGEIEDAKTVAALMAYDVKYNSDNK